MLFSLHAKNQIFFINFPVQTETMTPHFQMKVDGSLRVLTPVLPSETSVFERKTMLLDLVKNLIEKENLTSYRFLTSTCRSVPYLRLLQPELVLYEQNDEEAALYPELFIEMNEYAD